MVTLRISRKWPLKLDNNCNANTEIVLCHWHAPSSKPKMFLWCGILIVEERHVGEERSFPATCATMQIRQW